MYYCFKTCENKYLFFSKEHLKIMYYCFRFQVKNYVRVLVNIKNE